MKETGEARITNRVWRFLIIAVKGGSVYRHKPMFISTRIHVCLGSSVE